MRHWSMMESEHLRCSRVLPASSISFLSTSCQLHSVHTRCLFLRVYIPHVSMGPMMRILPRTTDSGAWVPACTYFASVVAGGNSFTEEATNQSIVTSGNMPHQYAERRGQDSARVRYFLAVHTASDDRCIDRSGRVPRSSMCKLSKGR